MDPYYVNEATIQDFVRSRRASAGAFRLGTPSLAIVIIERAARGSRRVATAIERWAAGAGEAVRPRSLPIH